VRLSDVGKKLDFEDFFEFLKIIKDEVLYSSCNIDLLRVQCTR
jgi:hypothetical protein